jgi:hypothetical protein
MNRDPAHAFIFDAAAARSPHESFGAPEIPQFRGQFFHGLRRDSGIEAVRFIPLLVQE